jgi:hypothetical protein
MQKVSVSVARAALWQATRKPASALSLAVLAILVLSFQTLWLIAAGLLVSVVVIGSHLASSAVWRRALDERWCAPPLLPEEAELADDEATAALLRLRGARVQRDRTAVQLGRPQACREVRLRGTIAELEATAVGLIRAIDRIGRRLDAVPRANLIREADQLARMAPEACGADRVCASAMEDARRTLAARRARQDDLERWKLLLSARLLTTIGALEQLPDWMLQVDARDHIRQLWVSGHALETLHVLTDGVGDEDDEMAAVERPQATLQLAGSHR